MTTLSNSLDVEHDQIVLSEIKAMQLHPDALIGLGRNAVQVLILETQYNAGGLVDQSLVGHIEEARQRLAQLPQDHREEINTMFTAEPSSSWLEASLGMQAQAGDREPKAFVEAVTARNTAGAYIVSNDLFLNFLGWHNYSLAASQHAFEDGVEEYKRSFKEDFNQAIDLGWGIPESARAHLARLDLTQFYVDDGFMTTVDESEAWAIGNYHDTHYVVAIAATGITKLRTLLLHELTHIVQGIDILPETTDVELLRPHETAGLNRIFGGGYGGQNLNEAVVEHLASSMENGHFDSVDPTSEFREGASDFVPRFLLHVLTKWGKHPVDIRRFVAAHFEDQQQAELLGKQSAQSQLRDELRRAFPFTDVIEEIAQLPGDDYAAPETMVAYIESLLERQREYNAAPSPINTSEIKA